MRDNGPPEQPSVALGRRTVLKLGVAAVGAAAGSTVLGFQRGPLSAAAAAAARPDIQFDVGQFLGPIRYFDADGTELSPSSDNPLQFRFGPVYTKFVTFRLKQDENRYEPTKSEQQDLRAALDQLESVYPFSPSGIFVFVAYGVPYFDRLPRSLVESYMPRLLSDPARWALEEARPVPTDYGQPDVDKPRFKVPVRITNYDMLLTLRSDSTRIIDDVVEWLRGSNNLKGRSVPSPRFSSLLEMDHTRSMMVSRPGQTRAWADQFRLPYAAKINPRSPMWMGFADQHTNAAGPAPIVTFTGNTSAKFTDAQPGDYFDNGTVQHLSHVLLDLDEFYSKSYSDRVGYMFRSNPRPQPGYTGTPPVAVSDGGPAYIVNEFRGTDDAELSAQGIGTPDNKPSIGHASALHRVSRAADGTPLHIRLDGPGFDSMDMDLPGVPPELKGKNQPKLQFSAFAASADLLRTLRSKGGAKDLADKYGVQPTDNGLEFFTTTTRRQNFLVPPRRHRAFPLVDLTRTITDGWDSKNGKTLTEDKKVYVLTAVDDDLWQVESRQSLTLQFEGGVPSGATIRRVVIYVRHFEEDQISAGAITWKVGGGSLRAPATFATVRPTQFIREEREARGEWDVTPWINTPAKANDLKFTIHNADSNGKKTYVNCVYVWVDYS